jgi:hypothetical protein
MIDLPKMMGAKGNECVVACVTMVAMYWRNTKMNLNWNLPNDFESREWNDFFEKGLSYVRMSGMPQNNIRRFLKALNLPLEAKLEFLEDMYGLRNLIDMNIPPIPLYDHTYFLKNIRGPGHSVVLVDQTDELFVSINPSLEPKFYYATIIIYPKTYRIEEIKIPTTTLMPYISEGGKAV